MATSGSETPPSGLGKLLSAAVASAAIIQGKDKPWVRQKLGKAISRTEHTIAAYEQGRATPSVEVMDILVRELTSLTYLNEAWVNATYDAAKDSEWQPPTLFDPLIRNVRARLPELPTYSFIGREKLLRQIAEATRKPGVHLLLYGEHGVGKTTVMRHLAELLKQRHNDFGLCDAIVWMDASDISIPDLYGELFRITAEQLSESKSASYSQEAGYFCLERWRVVVFIDNFPLRHRIEPRWFDEFPKRSRIIAACVAGEFDIKPFYRHTVHPFPIVSMTEAESRQLVIERTEDRAIAKRIFADPDWHTLLDLVDGKPKALDLIPGQFQVNGSLAPIIESLRNGEGQEVTEKLFPGSWTILHSQTDAKQVMLAASLFPHGIDRRRLVRITKLSTQRVTEVSAQLWRLGFFDTLSNEMRNPHYREHKTVRLFAEPRIEDWMRDRWIDEWIHDVTKCLERQNPTDSYWNTLISDQRLTNLDRDWHNLRFLLVWLRNNSAKRERYKLDLHRLVLLLSHYFDQRGLYSDRLAFARHLLCSYDDDAIVRLPLDRIREVILLQIDVLAWALVAVGEYSQAEMALLAGLRWIKLLDASSPVVGELTVLVHTFLAQLYGNWQESPGRMSDVTPDNLQAKTEEHLQIVRRSLTYEATSLPRFVAYRAYRILAEDAFVKGDVSAAHLYDQAREALNSYGGEAGVLLEMSLTAGFAALQEMVLDDAESLFREAEKESQPHTIQLAWTYYGLAIVAALRNEISSARNLLQKSMVILGVMDSARKLSELVQNLDADLGNGSQLKTPMHRILARALLDDFHRNRESVFAIMQTRARENPEDK